MKKIIFYLVLFWANMIFATEWHVSPTGTPSGLGTAASPWDLQTALNHPSVVVAGDTIWLHQGTYNDHYISNLNGTSSNYITVSSYPNEWAIIDGNIYPYVASAQPMPDPDTLAKDSGQTELTALIDDEEDPAILRVDGGFVKYMNFEITCLGPINRVYEYLANANGDIIGNCAPNNGFHKMAGISHSTVTKNKFINLVIRNVPGTGIGSWKETSDSEIYGCIIYYNGYIAYRRIGSCSATPSILGKGPGIYTQNRSSLYRLIKNNFISNNYDSGILVWSATTNPTFDYVKNYTLQDNTFTNNGSPQRDETSNLLINSAAVTLSGGVLYNQPFNIDVVDNMFYINQSTWNSGAFINNTKGVNFYNNNLYKGTVGNSISAANKNLSIHHNIYVGKRTQLELSLYGVANNNSFHHNLYYRRTGISVSGEFTVTGNNNVTLQMVQSSPYNSEAGSLGFFMAASTSPPNDCFNVGVISGTNPALSYTSTTCPTYIPNKTKVIQNQYDTNKYHVTIFNSQSHISTSVPITFSNVPAGTPYKVRDVQNYFGSFVSQGTLPANQQLSFNLAGNAFEPINGFYIVDANYPLVHSHQDFGTYIVEFAICIPIKTVTANVASGNTNNEQAGTSITANNTIDTNAVAVYHAGTTVVLANGFHSKATSRFRGYIAGCTNTYFGKTSDGETQIIDDNKPQSNSSAEKISVYPNPATSTISVSCNEVSINEVSIYSIDGKEIFRKRIGNTNIYDVDVSGLLNGMYIMNITTSDGSYTSKKIIKN